MAYTMRSTSKAAISQGSSRWREIGGILLLAFGVFLLLSLLSRQIGDGRLMGPLGHFAARTLYALVGLTAYLVAAALIVSPVRLLAGRPPIKDPGEACGIPLLLVALAVLLHLVQLAGGALGET